MDTSQANHNSGQEKTRSTSTRVKLIQLWLTGFAIGIPLLKFLNFVDFQYPEITVVVFFTILIFATMNILDVNDDSLRVKDIQPLSNCVVVTGYLQSTKPWIQERRFRKSDGEPKVEFATDNMIINYTQ